MLPHTIQCATGEGEASSLEVEGDETYYYGGDFGHKGDNGEPVPFEVDEGDSPFEVTEGGAPFVDGAQFEEDEEGEENGYNEDQTPFEEKEEEGEYGYEEDEEDDKEYYDEDDEDDEEGEEEEDDPTLLEEGNEGEFEEDEEDDEEYYDEDEEDDEEIPLKPQRALGDTGDFELEFEEVIYDDGNIILQSFC